MNPLEIIYQDEHLVAINKPHDLLVHQSSIARNAEEFAIQIVRDQIGQKVFPVHRLDRKTSGVLLFALDKETNRNLVKQFTNKSTEKKYWAIVRGFCTDELTIDYALHRDDGVLQDAVTKIKTLEKAEIDLPHGKHTTSRYSLIEAEPLTGRMHQIRKHMAHILHPIIGDRPHGCNKQNKLWLEKFGMKTMLLHAHSLAFTHPQSNQRIYLTAKPSQVFTNVYELLGFKTLNL
ncbi:pseudouridine synthase [Paenimyroides aestuarii]|uniref:tRNA pseudouridine synthase C n=1 Tax=Paenimyroides aestuarii TaxID=2968490 RepID=A0ABY5NTH8_9FLAO|nr:pseudouridine synthase [Paenimyroides aestuarii]UUV21877.1 pseudouridine synthase [Paenimyroides aestuarii]